MSLEQWAKSKQEIADLLGIADRDLRDAEGDISDDWKFNIAYNAALQLCTILLHSSGYRAEKNRAHYRTLQALHSRAGGAASNTAR